MAKKITTDFVRVATAGQTVDGRTIEPVWIEQMAASYDSKKYGALIWPEHYRWVGNYGEVLEVKAEEVDGVPTLFARLSPNSRLVQANEAGQMLYTSIEVNPNFAGTGEAYLIGLAVTDSPASLGTDRLTFSQQGNVYFEPVQLDLNNYTVKHENRIKQAFNALSGKSNDDEGNDSMKPEEIEALAKATATATAEALAPHFSALKPAPQEKEPADPGEGEQPAATQEQFNKLEEKLDGVMEELKTFRREPEGQLPGEDLGEDQQSGAFL